MIPEFLQIKLKSQYTEEDYNNILKSYLTKRKTTLRVNTLKTTKEKVEEILTQNNIKYRSISWSNFSLILEDTTEEIITELDIYKKGEIYLQSLSSQLPPIFLNPEENEQILDMTAAPGGKTTEIAALSNNKAMITATEKNKIRSERLKYNIEKLGAKKIVVLNTDARNLDEYFIFDKILLDAPCSGSGTLTEESLKNFTEDLVNRSTTFQKSLIEEAIKHLKVGGELIYSTCSILSEENEDIVNYVLSKYKNIELIPLDLTNYQDIPLSPSKEGTLCVLPNEIYEGFFISKFIKKNN